jgi:molybdenum cofactor cytidylyltransferase
VLFGAHHLPALAGLSGDRGARSLIEAAGSHVHEVEIESPGILLDVDTPADLEERAGHET